MKGPTDCSPLSRKSKPVSSLNEKEGRNPFLYKKKSVYSSNWPIHIEKADSLSCRRRL